MRNAPSHILYNGFSRCFSLQRFRVISALNILTSSIMLSVHFSSTLRPPIHVWRFHFGRNRSHPTRASALAKSFFVFFKAEASKNTIAKIRKNHGKIRQKIVHTKMLRNKTAKRKRRNKFKTQKVVCHTVYAQRQSSCRLNLSQSKVKFSAFDKYKRYHKRVSHLTGCARREEQIKYCSACTPSLMKSDRHGTSRRSKIGTQPEYVLNIFKVAKQNGFRSIHTA